MGNWNISINGIGSSCNGNSKVDVDHAVAVFVKTLMEMGQTITSATFTHGSAIDVKEIFRTYDYVESEMHVDCDAIMHHKVRSGSNIDIATGFKQFGPYQLSDRK